MFQSEDLFEKVLTRYIERGADELRIVTGYASPEMCTRLLVTAAGYRQELNIKLLVGMTGYEGITVDTHEGLLSVLANPPKESGSLSIQYVTNGISVHSKLFVWLKDGLPLGAWMGSSNFTQNGFGVGFRGGKHKEIMTTTDVESALAYFAAVEGVSIDITHPDVDSEIPIHNRPLHTSVSVASSEGERDLDFIERESVVLPLIVTKPGPGTPAGQVHLKSGLNWGQRPGREPNQAYIPVPVHIARSGFFPPKGVMFRVTTTDNKLFLMTVAQDNDKALETPQNNSFIGEYFRMRLGVSNGKAVTLSDLRKFGSRFVTFYRVDDGDEEPSYIMDYSPEAEDRGANFYDL